MWRGMLARFNLPAVLERTRRAKRVLDVGGAFAPLNTATHVIDNLPIGEAGEPLITPPPRTAQV